MKIGIIGPAQSGKTTLFKILLQSPDITSDIGIFKVRDERIERVSEIFSSKKKVYPEFTFLDIHAALEFKSSDYTKLQGIDLFICVIGACMSENPKKDIEGYITDIILSDLEAVQNRMDRIEKDRMKLKYDIELELKLLHTCQEFLSQSRLLSKAGINKDELKLFSGFEFISLRPVIIGINMPDKPEEKLIKEIETYCASLGLNSFRFFGKTELELLELSPTERLEFSKEMGIEANIRENISELISRKLNLITFFTGGEKETTGWYLEAGLPIIEAAGKIHSDMKRGFIKAEVVKYNDLARCEYNMQKVREAGLLRVEGKEYIVQDGDIVNIRFNI